MSLIRHQTILQLNKISLKLVFTITILFISSSWEQLSWNLLKWVLSRSLQHLFAISSLRSWWSPRCSFLLDLLFPGSWVLLFLGLLPHFGGAHFSPINLQRSEQLFLCDLTSLEMPLFYPRLVDGLARYRSLGWKEFSLRTFMVLCHCLQASLVAKTTIIWNQSPPLSLPPSFPHYKHFSLFLLFRNFMMHSLV